MANIVCKTTYFDKPGGRNTDETLGLAKSRAEKLGIRNIVVASTSGVTGVKASRVFKGYNLVVVTVVAGTKESYGQEAFPENRAIIERNGGKIVRATHALGGVGRAIYRRFGGIQVDEIIAHVLRLFGDGVKAACEVTCMAADAGMIGTDEDAIGIGGSAGGADTALVLKPSNTHIFFDLRIKETICKPSL